MTAAAEVDLDLIRAQVDAVFGDLQVAAVKTGMLASAAVIETVAKALRDHRPPHYVLDPVMISKTGFPLLRPEAISALSELLLPLATLVTPNVHEAQALTGLEVRTPGPGGGRGAPAGRGGRPGGARQGRTPRGAAGDGRPRHAGRACGSSRASTSTRVHTHGTGCTYSAAIATQLAHGRSLEDAIARAKAYVTEAIRAGLPDRAGDRPDRPLLLPAAPGRLRALGRAAGGAGGRA